MQAVIFDWRGTLVTTPTFGGWVREALRRLGRSLDDAPDLAEALGGAKLDEPGMDADAEVHRAAFYAAFRAAGLDDELADALYEVESDASANPFAEDAAETLHGLKERGLRIGVLSDVHFDIRPAFEGLPVDSFVLSFEHGVQKPEPAIFRYAMEELGTDADRTLMVGDRASHDGGALEVGMPTLLVPPLTDVRQRRLHLVTRLAA
ncbi:HAD family hydrolase [Saccharothrix coeruleofusca]|uniref:Hydrolase n=1 Tax=Saccharothrix coeruleofusca TaxID=33919 RepID=A0A918EDW2_9PSEU|nr:HAD-IA family hydrolase [Saccharothrix coeruleofusca]MBP2338065.1 HAD superfamily hydrolase (TIGR01509 family) [Saccharothrix coeruleofusca]GGP50975.1 hydrolase [Saccharothrix coeruleofusca]